VEKRKDKVIILDYGIFMFRSIYSWRNNKQIPPEYTCLNMMTSCLKKIGVEPMDTIIVACDYGRSWRKDVDKQYKADRKEARERQTDINWEDMFKRFNELEKKIQIGTDWHVVKEWSFEADDLMAVACRYYKDKEVILVTFDADVEQLSIYDNVKIFSPLKKYKGKKGGYKHVKEPLKVLAQKIEKETADNLTNPILSKEDYEKREQIVSLLTLPEFVENRIKDIYDNLTEKEYINDNAIPYSTMRNKIATLYNNKKDIVNYEDSINYKPKKRRKKCKK